MRKVIINENQRGLLFKDGRYVKMLEAGKYLEVFDRIIEVCETSQPIHSFACDLAGIPYRIKDHIDRLTF